MKVFMFCMCGVCMSVQVYSDNNSFVTLVRTCSSQAVAREFPIACCQIYSLSLSHPPSPAFQPSHFRYTPPTHLSITNSPNRGYTQYVYVRVYVHVFVSVCMCVCML
jgi:hypothetical protein